MLPNLTLLFFFFFNDPATTEIYPLPLHDALPISAICQRQRLACPSFLGTATRKIRRRPTRTRRQSRPTQREAFFQPTPSSCRNLERRRRPETHHRFRDRRRLVLDTRLRAVRSRRRRPAVRPPRL